MTMEIEMKNIQEAEGLETPEGLMKPLIFGERLGVIHLEIPAGLEVSPHAHTTEGVLYCLSGYRNRYQEPVERTSKCTIDLITTTCKIG
jgi:quercetin dioxygenase-like cupin family protein